jgi:hypothetical protein
MRFDCGFIGVTHVVLRSRNHAHDAPFRLATKAANTSDTLEPTETPSEHSNPPQIGLRPRSSIHACSRRLRHVRTF